jgi:hypothetical protein
MLIAVATIAPIPAGLSGRMKELSSWASQFRSQVPLVSGSICHSSGDDRLRKILWFRFS